MEIGNCFGRKMKEVDKVNGGKGGELQQIKGWKWEAGTRRG